MEENRPPFDHPDSTGVPGGMILSIFPELTAPREDVPERPHDESVSREDLLAFISFTQQPSNPAHPEPEYTFPDDEEDPEDEDEVPDEEVLEAWFGPERQDSDHDEDETDAALIDEVFENGHFAPVARLDFNRPIFDVNAVMIAMLQNPGLELGDLGVYRQQPTEVWIREALAKRQLKSQILLEQLWIAENIAVQELPLAEVKQIHELLTTHHPNPHRLLKIVIEMTKLDNVRKVIVVARRFRSKVEQLHDRMDAVSSQVPTNDSWREVDEDNAPVYYINEEGLTRVDPPVEWIAANQEIDRRVELIQTEIRNIEEFVVARTNRLLYEIHGEKKNSKKLIRKIKKAIEEENLDDAHKNSLVDAQEIVEALAEKVFDKVIDFFFYSPPIEIPGFPQFGVTNAHSQRRNRENPNFLAELEAYFDAPEENEQLA